MKNRRNKIFLICIAGFITLLTVPFLGMVDIDIHSIFEKGSRGFIFWQLRLPRVILSFLAGSALALGGLVFQNIFKNSLATPYTLGVSSGAAAGAVIAIKLNLTITIFGLNWIYISGFAGGLVSIFLILGITRITKNYSVYTILMSGVAINFFFSSFILLLQYMVDITQTISVLRWLMGSISTSGYNDIFILLPAWIFFVIIIFLVKKELLLISGGEEFAGSRGLNVKAFKIILFIIVSFITGIIVSIVGPIGFIGLIVPHISRLIIKNDFKVLIFFTIFLGGIILTFADMLSRLLIPPVEIPVGIITSFFGAPFFLFILISGLRKKR
ncbi:MAG: iron ABC transporter permease [Acidobacteriota bacterium]